MMLTRDAHIKYRPPSANEDAGWLVLKDGVTSIPKVCRPFRTDSYLVLVQNLHY